MILLALTACFGLNAAKVPNQDIYADDGETRTAQADVHFAVVGDVRPALPGEKAKRALTPHTEAAIVDDISKAITEGRITFVTLLGDLVPASTTANWKEFSADWAKVLSGTELPTDGLPRVRVVPVAGNHERAGGDDKLEGFGAAFQGVGADIGFNRVASWYAFDLVVKGHRWKMVVLDSDKGSLGSRWKEQTDWLEKTTLEKDYDSMVVFMHHPLLTLATGHPSNEGGGPLELLDLIDEHSRIGVVKVVFAGHVHTNEVFLPGGRLGEMYITAGGGGSPADHQLRWGHAEAAGPGYLDLKLETIFDLALVKEFGRWAEEKAFPQAIVDKGRGEGSYAGYPAEFDANYFPIQGWWDVGVLGADLDLTFRMVGGDGTLKDLYNVYYSAKDGWKIGR